jgi:hypothetical protein
MGCSARVIARGCQLVLIISFRCQNIDAPGAYRRQTEQAEFQNLAAGAVWIAGC